MFFCKGFLISILTQSYSISIVCNSSRSLVMMKIGISPKIVIILYVWRRELWELLIFLWNFIKNPEEARLFPVESVHHSWRTWFQNHERLSRLDRQKRPPKTVLTISFSRNFQNDWSQKWRTDHHLLDSHTNELPKFSLVNNTCLQE